MNQLTGTLSCPAQPHAVSVKAVHALNPCLPLRLSRPWPPQHGRTPADEARLCHPLVLGQAEDGRGSVEGGLEGMPRKQLRLEAHTLFGMRMSGKVKVAGRDLVGWYGRLEDWLQEHGRPAPVRGV